MSTAMLALLAVSWSLSGHEAAAQVPPAPSNGTQAVVEPKDARSAVFVCYELELNEEDAALDEEAAEEEAADQETGFIRLRTALFGPDSLTADHLEVLCVSSEVISDEGEEQPTTTTANVTTSDAEVETRVLACLGVEDGSDERDDFELFTEYTGADSVFVRASELLCEEAALTVEGTTIGEASGALWLCHGVRDGDNADVTVDITNIFGADDLEVDSLARVCAPATDRNGGANEPTVAATVDTEESTDAQLTMLACFDVDDGSRPDEVVTIETESNGEVEVTLGDAVLLCRAAEEASDEASDESEEEDSPAVNGALSTQGGREFQDEIDRLIDFLITNGSEDDIERAIDALEAVD